MHEFTSVPMSIDPHTSGRVEGRLDFQVPGISKPLAVRADLSGARKLADGFDAVLTDQNSVADSLVWRIVRSVICSKAVSGRVSLVAGTRAVITR